MPPLASVPSAVNGPSSPELPAALTTSTPRLNALRMTLAYKLCTRAASSVASNGVCVHARVAAANMQAHLHKLTYSV